MGEVVVRLERADVEAVLSALGYCEEHGEWYSRDDGVKAKLCAALDSPSVEEPEYRVVADFATQGDQSITLVGPEDIERNEKMYREAVASYRHGGVYKNPQAQSRTITTLSDGSELIGPWVDLEEGERG